MRGVRVAAFACAVAGLALAVSGNAKEPKLKQLMGENFAGLQTILAALITSNYAAVPAQVEIIQEHASQLTKMVPASAESDRDRFMTYAYNLGANAADLKRIAQLLVQEEKAQAEKKGTVSNELREAAAAHYGGMVTMCVACHNRFRPGIAAAP